MSANAGPWRRLHDVKQTYQLVRPYVGGSGRHLVVVAATSILAGFTEAFLLYVVVQSATAIAAGATTSEIDVAVFHWPEVSTSSMLVLGLALVAVLLAMAVVNSLAVASVTSQSLNRARRRTFAAYMNSTWAQKTTEPEGRLTQVLTVHLQRVGIGLLQVTKGVTAGLNLIAYLVSAGAIEPVAAGAVLVGVVAIGACLFPLARATRRISRSNMDVTVEYARLVDQSIRMAREIDTFGVRDEVVAEVGGTADAAERLAFRTRFLTGFTPNVYQYTALALLVGGMLIVSATDTLEVGALGAIVLLMVRALSYGQQLSTTVQQLSDTRPYVSSVVQLEQRYDRNRRTDGEVPLARVERLEVRGVDFGYAPDHLVLRSVDLDIPFGRAVGLVGPSGSGKSTLVQVLLGLRQPLAGSYLVNGVPASSYREDDWTRHFALVPQDNLLLTGTVAENIRLFRPGFTDEEVRRAAELAHLHEDIVALPEGYDTVLGQGKRDLSGGQRQRLGLARALLGSPSVLVLDEPTSALDMRSESLIQQTLAELKGTITLVVVAHRMPTLTICDEIVVLEAGSIVATGSHEDLQRSSDFYRDALRLSHMVN